MRTDSERSGRAWEIIEREKDTIRVKKASLVAWVITFVLAGICMQSSWLESRLCYRQ